MHGASQRVYMVNHSPGIRVSRGVDLSRVDEETDLRRGRRRPWGDRPAALSDALAFLSRRLGILDGGKRPFGERASHANAARNWRGNAGRCTGPYYGGNRPAAAVPPAVVGRGSRVCRRLQGSRRTDFLLSKL
jgi:hypothetical protein